MTNNKRIWLSLAHMGGHEQIFIQEAFDTNWVVPLGPNVNGFEEDLEQFLGERVHVVALSSGTAAIHLALIMLGVEPGDEVLCQSFTFAASPTPSPTWAAGRCLSRNLDMEHVPESWKSGVRIDKNRQ